MKQHVYKKMSGGEYCVHCTREKQSAVSELCPGQNRLEISSTDLRTNYRDLRHCVAASWGLAEDSFLIDPAFAEFGSLAWIGSIYQDGAFLYKVFLRVGAK